MGRRKGLRLGFRVYFGGELLFANHLFPHSGSDRCAFGKGAPSFIAVLRGRFLGSQAPVLLQKRVWPLTLHGAHGKWDPPCRTAHGKDASAGHLCLQRPFSALAVHSRGLGRSQRLGVKEIPTFACWFNLKSFPRTQFFCHCLVSKPFIIFRGSFTQGALRDLELRLILNVGSKLIEMGETGTYWANRGRKRKYFIFPGTFTNIILDSSSAMRC